MQSSINLRCAPVMLFIILACASSAAGQSTYPTDIDTPRTLPILADNQTTSLTAAINSSATIIAVASTAGFPDVSVVQVGNEWMKAEVVSLTQLLMTRGFGGTVAMGHPRRSPVRVIFTSEYLNPLRQSVIALQMKLGKFDSSPLVPGQYLRSLGMGPVLPTSEWSTILMEDLGTGTPSSSNYLRGDGSWQAIPPGLSGSGTPGRLVKWTGATSQGDSLLSESGTALSATATLSLFTPLPVSVPLTIKGAASQSADLQQWRNSGGTVLASVNNGGDGAFAGLSTTGDVNAGSDLYVTNALNVYAGSNLGGGIILNTSHGITWAVDGDGDIGTSGSNRPNYVYVRTAVEAASLCLPGSVCWTSGATAPAGFCNPGSLYTRTSNGKLYVCEAGSYVMK